MNNLVFRSIEAFLVQFLLYFFFKQWRFENVPFCLKTSYISILTEPTAPLFKCSFQCAFKFMMFQSLSAMQAFHGLDRDIEGSAKRWKKFVESEAIENEKFPTEWKNKTVVQRLCMIRVLRPDRMIYAIELVKENYIILHCKTINSF